jgi:hypothetical protein
MAMPVSRGYVEVDVNPQGVDRHRPDIPRMPGRMISAKTILRWRERMRPTAHLPLWRNITLGALVLLWIGLSWLLVVSQGKPESFLRMTFAGHSRPDAFHDLNRAALLFWVMVIGL